jgi:tetratricopeptide (TPR) repeat protein
MNHNEHVLHEFSVQANGLLYLLVNDDYISQDGTRKKNAQVYAKDLENAIDRYQQFIDDERTFFEMGILKRTKDDTYSKLVCYQQILKCYKNLLSLKNIDRDQYIEGGVQLCDELLKLLDKIATQDIGQKKEDLVRYCKHMNAIAEFYIFINREKSRAINIFTISAEQAEKYNMTLFYLEALVGLADIFSRLSKHRFSAFFTQVSIRHLKRCNSKESLLEMQRQKRHIQERICKIQRQNEAMVLKHCFMLWLSRRHERGKNHVQCIY